MSPGAKERITEAVSGWDGVTTGSGRFGSVRYLVGRRELGHLHGDGVLDLPMPPALKRELLERGEVEPHRWTPPDSGWVTLRLGSEADVDRAIDLLAGQYERALSKGS